MKFISKKITSTVIAISIALLGTMSDNLFVSAAWAAADDLEFNSLTCDATKTANNECYDGIYALNSDATEAYNSCCAGFIEYQTVETSSNLPFYRCMTEA